MRTGRSLTVCCSLLPGGVCSRGGVPGPLGGVPGLGEGLFPGGVCLVWGGVPGLGGVCSRGGVCVPGLGGVPGPEGCIPACTEADTLPVDRILDTRLWKYYLGPTSLRPVIIDLLHFGHFAYHTENVHLNISYILIEGWGLQ